MRRAILLLLAIFLLGFGCLEEKGFPGSKAELLTNTQVGDVDADGSPDYLVYDYSPITVNDAGMKVQRQVTVVVETSSIYTSINPNLTDIDMLVANQDLEEFGKSRTTADTACSQAIGLSNFVCSDVNTCSKLCSSASLKCKKIAAVHDEALTGAMKAYVNANNEIRTLLLESQRMAPTLRTASDDDKNLFLNKLRSIVARVAEINANPLYTNSEMTLCTHSDFDLHYVVEAANKVGTYETQNSSYRYRVLLSVKPTQQTSSEQLGVETAGVGLSDRMTRTAVPQSEQISSIQAFTASEDASSVIINWTSAKPNEGGYLFYYEFISPEPPENVISAIKTPDLRVRKINLVPLAPTNFIFITLNGIVGNYFIALGAALGLTLAALFAIYNIVILLFTMVSEKAAGASFTMGFRKAFGRTDVKWRTDIIVAVILLAGGFYVSSAMATQPSTPPPLLESVDFLIRNDWGIVGIGLMLLGVLMAYLAIENFTKITILEKAYGMVIRQEKDLFIAKAGALKERLKELEKLVEEYSKEDFDVSKEFDLLTTIKADKVDALTKDMTARSKALIDDYLTRVETAIGSLKEKKKMADENWPKWKEAIGKMLDEQGEVYTSSLVTVPASLRAWSLSRYVKEQGAEGLAFDRDAIKKRKISPDQLVQELIGKGILRGAIVMKQDKVVLAEFAEGSSTVMTALALKLNSYLRSLAKNLGQHPPSSFVAIGDKYVVVIMKNRLVDSILFIGKDKFKDAIETWKTKIKAFETGG